MNYDHEAVEAHAEHVALHAALLALYEAFPDKRALMACLRRQSDAACAKVSGTEVGEIALASFDKAFSPYLQALARGLPQA